MIDELLYKLNSGINLTLNRYLLIDGLASVSGLNSLHIKQLKTKFGEKSISAVLRPEIAYIPESCPQLFLLAEAGQLVDQELVEQSVNLALTEYLYSKKYICGWISSECELDVLSENIVSIGSALGSSLDVKPFIPFYEPIRLQLLQEANFICPDWLSTVLRVMNSYYYLTVDMQLKEVTRASYTSELQNLFITEETKYYQTHAKKINHLYIGWGTYCKDNQKVVNSGDLLKLANLYQQANLLGLTNTQDNFVYSLNTMEYGNLLDNEALLAEIKAAVEDQGSLARRFYKLDDKFFLELKQ